MSDTDPRDKPPSSPESGGTRTPEASEKRSSDSSLDSSTRSPPTTEGTDDAELKEPDVGKTMSNMMAAFTAVTAGLQRNLLELSASMTKASDTSAASLAEVSANVNSVMERVSAVEDRDSFTTVTKPNKVARSGANAGSSSSSGGTASSLKSKAAGSGKQSGKRLTMKTFEASSSDAGSDKAVVGAASNAYGGDVGDDGKVAPPVSDRDDSDDSTGSSVPAHSSSTSSAMSVANVRIAEMQAQLAASKFREQQARDRAVQAETDREDRARRVASKRRVTIHGLDTADGLTQAEYELESKFSNRPKALDSFDLTGPKFSGRPSDLKSFLAKLGHDLRNIQRPYRLELGLKRLQHSISVSFLSYCATKGIHPDDYGDDEYLDFTVLCDWLKDTYRPVHAEFDDIQKLFNVTAATVSGTDRVVRDIESQFSELGLPVTGDELPDKFFIGTVAKAVDSTLLDKMKEGGYITPTTTYAEFRKRLLIVAGASQPVGRYSSATRGRQRAAVADFGEGSGDSAHEGNDSDCEAFANSLGKSARVALSDSKGNRTPPSYEESEVSKHINDENCRFCSKMADRGKCDRAEAETHLVPCCHRLYKALNNGEQMPTSVCARNARILADRGSKFQIRANSKARK